MEPAFLQVQVTLQPHWPTVHQVATRNLPLSVTLNPLLTKLHQVGTRCYLSAFQCIVRSKFIFHFFYILLLISSIQPAAGWAGRRAGQTRSASLLSLRRGEGTQKTRQNYITSIFISSYTQMDLSHCSGYSMYWFVTNILNLLPTHFHVYSFVLLILKHNFYR